MLIQNLIPIPSVATVKQREREREKDKQTSRRSVNVNYNGMTITKDELGKQISRQKFVQTERFSKSVIPYQYIPYQPYHTIPNQLCNKNDDFWA